MLVVVGGHSRKLGKTSVVTGLIRRLRDRQWTALKISPHDHAASAGPGHHFAPREEHRPSRTDTGRYLAAGARRSLWLRTTPGELPRAAETVRELLRLGQNVIVESSSILEFVQPDVCVMLLDFSCPDFKASSLRFLDRADAFLIIRHGLDAPPWRHVPPGLVEAKTQFHITPPRYVTAGIAAFVASHGAGI